LKIRLALIGHPNLNGAEPLLAEPCAVVLHSVLCSHGRNMLRVIARVKPNEFCRV
jgi:hypothetical protein